jgi:2-polyprenyl-6-methoxyphenol hydroxylase-like FAD-dependent oxidoreductase
MNTTSNPRIAIVGAGPAGLLCARVLQRHGVGVTVYDADASVHSRDTGGTLDLHADSGQIALADAGLMAEFTQLARQESQAKTRLDQHGTVLSSFVPDDDDASAPEIDRGQLRAMLAAHVESDTVRWGHKLVAATPSGAGTHRLSFDNGVVVEADLVVGADGAWSRVRPLVSDAVPYYTGVTQIEVRFDDVDRRHPGIARLVGAGHMFANNGDGQAIIGQRNSDGRVRGYVGLRTELDWYVEADVDLADPNAVRRYLLARFSGWSAQLLPFISDSAVYINRPMFVLPAPPTWPHTPGVTLLGDAAHLMSPFGGHGANLAMLDGAELARAIITEPDLDKAITRYETTMTARSGPLAVDANMGLNRFYTNGSHIPDHRAEHQRYQADADTYRREHNIPAV